MPTHFSIAIGSVAAGVSSTKRRSIAFPRSPNSFSSSRLRPRNAGMFVRHAAR